MTLPLSTSLGERIQALAKRIASGNADLATVNEMNRLLAQTGETIPPAVEAAALRIALAHYPDDGPMLRRLCAINTMLGQPITPELEARTLASTLLERPEDLALKSRLATVKQQLAMRSIEQAVELAKAVRDENPGDYWANYNLALAYLYYWRPMDAWSYARRAIEIDPRQLYAYELLYDIACRISDPRGAGIMPNLTAKLIEIFDRALRTHPDLDLFREPGFATRQRVAISSGIPPILVNTLPKSGTVYIRGRLSEALDVPFQHLTVAALYKAPIPSWLEGFALGGAVATEHFLGDDKTIGLLSSLGLRKIVVHVRDPRQSALSMFYFLNKQSRYSGPIGTVAGDVFRAFPEVDRNFREHCEDYIPWTVNWLHSWIESVETARSELQVKFTTYDKFLESEDSFFSDILQFFEIDPARFDRGKTLSERHKEHFRSGSLTEWRKVLTDETQEYISSLVDRDVLKYFGWND